MMDYNEKPKDNEWLKPLHQPKDDFFKGAKPIIVYTQSQLDSLLKAEREKAIMDVIKIFNKEATRCLHAAEEVKPLTILGLVGKLLSTDESKDEAK